MTPVSSRLVQSSTPIDQLVQSPFPPTVIRLQLDKTLPFHRLYYGRVNGPNINYHESVTIRFLRGGSEMWSTAFLESNVDVATILTAGTTRLTSEGVASPPYCIATVENSSSTIIDPQPRELLVGTDWIRANVRVRTSSTVDLTSRVNCAPVKVMAEADTVELVVRHDSGLTSSDAVLGVAQRVWFLAVNSSNVPA